MPWRRHGRPVTVPPEPRVGLVLGGGGLVGQAYHAGALVALEHDLHWDPRSAAVIVGTSAGAVTGSLLRLGVTAPDLAGVFTDVSGISRALLGVETLPELAPLRLRDLLRPQLPTPALVRRGLAMPWLSRPTTAALSMLHDGALDVADHLAFLAELAAACPLMPHGSLRLVTVDQADGSRVVLEPGTPSDLVPAVAASCAVPGYFAPVTVDGRRLIDGGAHSATNADLLLDDELDLVIVVSPLSGRGRLGRTLDALVRRLAARTLRAEVAALEGRGTPVVVVEPTAAAVVAMGHDLLGAAACLGTVSQGFLDVGRRTSAEDALLHLRLGRAA